MTATIELPSDARTASPSKVYTRRSGQTSRDQPSPETQCNYVPASDSLDGQPLCDTQTLSTVEGKTGRDQARPEVHASSVPASISPDSQEGHDAHSATAVEGRTPAAAAIEVPSTDTATLRLLDPTLLTFSALLDDLERVRVATENRVRQLTRDEPDKDGNVRGFALDDTDPQVRVLLGHVEALKAQEHAATLDLQRALRKHPLGAWVKSTVGIGEKQGARLLAAIGDPYWRPEIRNEDGTIRHPEGPRTVSALWAYCGLHVLPVGQCGFATQWNAADGAHLPASRDLYVTPTGIAGGSKPGGTGQVVDAAQKLARRCWPAGVAAERRKGVRSNWNPTAKMRAYLIAESCIKQARSPYRAVYDKRRAHTAVTHPDWTAGHSHNDALRIVAKEVVKDLWRAARDIYESEDMNA